jgi:YbbR domain-containing protein
VRRFVAFLLHNWPLKLGAVLLATVLYAGLVLGQNVRTWTGQIPIDAVHPPAGATLLSDLPPITLVRYRAPLDVGVLSPDSFNATVDLARIQAAPGGAAQTVPVTLVALDQRVQIVDFQPQQVEVRLDEVTSNQLAITVDMGTVPQGISVGTPQTDPSTVTVRGASSRVQSVTAIEARVTIDASALNIDRTVDLVPVDANGNQVPNVELDPAIARVRVSVAQQLANRTLPVVAQITGQPAPGYRITSITVSPLVVTVSGEEAVVTQLQTAMTEPIDVSGRTTDLDAMVGFALPQGASVAGSDQVSVSLTIAQETGSQTFQVAVLVAGGQPGFSYVPDVGAVQVTLAGPLQPLDAVNAGTLTATADVSALGVGTNLVTLTFAPPDGLDLVAVNPAQVTVQVSPLAGSSPSPGP